MEYYRLLQSISDGQKQDKEERSSEGKGHCERHWQHWVLFMLRGVEETAKMSLDLVEKMSLQMQEFKRVVRPALDKQYSHELMNHLFMLRFRTCKMLSRLVDEPQLSAWNALWSWVF